MASEFNNTVAEVDLYKVLRSPSNPYGMYNNQDRFLNAVYRAFTTGELKNLYEGWGTDQLLKGRPWVNRADAVTRRAANFFKAEFAYEKQSNVISQHFWATTALLGVGYSLNNSALGGGAGASQQTIAQITLARSAINAILESALLLGNGVRYNTMVYRGGDSAAPQATKDYAANVKVMRGALGAAGSFGFTANALVGIGLAAAKIDAAKKSGDAVALQSACIELGSHVANTAANFFKGLNGVYSTQFDKFDPVTGAPKPGVVVPTVKTPFGTFAKTPRTWLASTNKGFGVAGSVFGVVNGILSIAILAPMLARTDLTPEQRAILAAEMSVQVVGGVIQGASNIVLALTLVSSVSIASRVVNVAAFGAAAAGLMLCLSPLEIYGLVKQSQYADQLEALGKEMSASGYDGDTLLADLYGDKTAAEGGIVAATMLLATVSTVTSLLASTGVGAVVSLVTGIVAGILKGCQQPIIEKVAQDYVNKINDAGGSFAYFSKNLAAKYSMVIGSEANVNYLAALQKAYGVDSVIGVTTTQISKTALELAAITKNTADLQTATAYVDRFADGLVVADQTLSINTETGLINVGGAAGASQLLTFLTPLMTPGSETRVRVSTGKNSYFTSLDVAFSGTGWTITEGDARSVMDLSKVASRLYGSDNVLKRDVAVNVKSGAGDDVVLANASTINFDGGSGVNTISYQSLNLGGGTGGIRVTPTPTGFSVAKEGQASVYAEIVASQQYVYGKRTETVQYRDIELRSVYVTATDTLTNVQNITGTDNADNITGNAQNNILVGGLGNDTINGNDGNDIISGGAGNNVLDGGNGVDTVDLTDRLVGQSGLTDFVRVQVKLGPAGYVNVKTASYYGGQYNTLAASDVLNNFENVQGTSFPDEITGDDQANQLAGAGGNDVIIAGGGDDVLAGGGGVDTLSGGIGYDTADYSDTPGGAGKGVWATLLTGRASAPGVASQASVGLIAYETWNGTAVADATKYDTLAGIEALVGSSEADFLEGNHDVNSLAGGAGNDKLYGQGGSDYLSGGSGSDYLGGGDGVDTADYADAGGRVVVNLPTGTATVSNSAGALVDTDTLVSIENVRGSGLNDALFGNDLANNLAGGAGDDEIRGNGGNDVLVGGTGLDSLYGGDGDDTFVQDRLIDENPTGTRIDYIVGGAGIDTVDYGGVTLRVNDSAGINVDLLTLRATMPSGHYDQLESVENVIGTIGFDQIKGDGNVNILSGQSGDDRIYGAGGDDMLFGGDGNDELNGDDGKDFIDGGEGDDFIHGGLGDDFVAGAGAGSDIFYGDEGFDTLDYSASDNGYGIRTTLDGVSATGSLVFKTFTAATNSIGGGRSDKAIGFEGIIGTKYADDIAGDANDNVLEGGAGDDKLSGGAGNDSLSGDAGADTISGGDGDDSIQQNIERVNDTIDGGAGIDIVDYSNTAFVDGTRTDMGVVGISADLATGKIVKYTATATLAAATDTVSNIETVVGTSLNDTLLGDASANGLFGGAGDDRLEGRDGYDVLDGSAGNDILLGGAGKDTLFGGAGADDIQGGDDDDIIQQDIERVNDRIDGGAGSDLVDYSLTGFANYTRTDGMGANGIVADLGLGTVKKFNGVYTDGIDTLISIENLQGSMLNDTITGSSADNSLSGGLGNDTVSGGAGNDVLLGGGGADTLNGNEGDDLFMQDIERVHDVINGGAGVDSVDYAVTAYEPGGRTDMGATPSSVGIVANLETGRVDKYSGFDTAAYDTLVEIENVSGSELNDTITGNAASNTLTGAGGNDTLTGGAGNDMLSGGNGLDVLNGGDGNDTLSGGTDADTINGDAGDDVILQILELSNETINGGTGVDTLDYRVTSVYPTAATVGINADLVAGKIIKTAVGGTATTGFDAVSNVENVFGTGLADTLSGNADANMLSGGAGNDTLSGLAGGDFLDGGAGNDTLSGGDGADVLAGGTGNDTLSGGLGSDLYVFNFGDGSETIQEMDVAASGSKDVLRFGPGIGQAALWFARTGNDLTISVLGTTDKVVVLGWFADSANQLENIKTATGVELSAAGVTQLVAATGALAVPASVAAVPAAVATAIQSAWTIDNGNANTLIGGAGNDVLTAGTGDDTIDGGLGSDTLSGGAGDDLFLQDISRTADSIDGGAGNDTVDYTVSELSAGRSDGMGRKGIVANLTTGRVDKYQGVDATAFDTLTNIENITGSVLDDTITGNAGANILEGSGGNDMLTGGAGNDIYVFGRGDDQDTIVDTDATAGNRDTLVFAKGVTYDQLWFARVGNDLKISLIGTTDAVTVSGWYLGGANQIENFVADGRGLRADRVEILVFAMSSKTMPPEGEVVLPGATQTALATAFAAAWTSVPVNSGYFSQLAVKDVDTKFSSANGNALTVSDSDSTSLTCSLSVANGTLTLAGTTGLSSVTGNSTANVVMTGSPASINAALNGLNYRPTIGFVGNDKLTITTDDSTSVDTDAVAITVAAGNTAPTTGTIANPTATKVADLFNYSVANPFSDTQTNDKRKLIYTATGLPDGLNYGLFYNAATDTLVFSGTPLAAGIYNVTVKATDEGGMSATSSFTLTVGAATSVINGTTAFNTLTGTAGNDWISNGGGGADNLSGGGGNDIYVVSQTNIGTTKGDWVSDTAGLGVDTVLSSASYTLSNAQSGYATSGNNADNLFLTGAAAINATGNTMNNVLRGNSASNTLTGGYGNDTYLFGRGAGSDTIVDVGTAGDGDVLQLAADVAYNQLWFKHVGTNLEISILGTAVKVTIQNWYAGTTGSTTVAANLVEKIVASDGKQMLAANVESLVTAMAGMTAPTSPNSSFFDLTAAQQATLASLNAWNTVTPIGMAPINTVPAAQSATEDTAMFFSSANGNAITVLDSDSTSLTSTLSVTNGVLNLGSTTNVTVTGNGTASVQVAGTAANINLALNGLSYTPALNYNGPATLTVLTSDGALSDTDTVAITVAAANDAPTAGALANPAATKVADLFSYSVANPFSDLETTSKSKLIYTASGLPDGLNYGLRYDAATNMLVFSGTPLAAGTYNVTVKATDEGGLSATSSFALTVGAATSVINGTTAVNSIVGTAGNDWIDGKGGGDTAWGQGGNDIFVIYSNSDKVVELAGNGIDTILSPVTISLANAAAVGDGVASNQADNVLLTGTAAINASGNALNNVLRGNSASNVLTGGTGNDTYLFGRGGASDTIVDTDSTAGNSDTLQFGSDVAFNQLWFKHVGTNLEISILGTTDKVTIQNWYSATTGSTTVAANLVENIVASDGKKVLAANVDQLVQAMAGMVAPTAANSSFFNLTAAQQTTLTGLGVWQ